MPSRDDDRFLFGDRTPWTGAEIIERAGGFEAAQHRGADVDVNPLDRSAGPVILNDTDRKRAEIVRRYRLQSHQPDEFINFAAIAGMGQRRDLDPKLYQYGGLWIYPIAGLLGAAHVVGYVELTGDLAWYLDRPGEFGKFYIVARLYSAMWGAIGAGVVFVLVRRLSKSDFAAFCGAMAFAMLPVVVTAAHEAKPHLAGAVLLLWAVLKADDYVRTGRRRDAVWAGALAGGASAMVVSMVVGFAVLPVMGVLAWWQSGATASPRNPGATASPAGEAVLPDQINTASPSGEAVAPGAHGVSRPRENVKMVGLAILSGMLVYCVTNPYVVWNLLFDRSVFQSNIGNSTAMYGVTAWEQSVINTVRLVIASTTANTILCIAWLSGGIAGALLASSRPSTPPKNSDPPHDPRERPAPSLGWLLLTAAAAALAFFVPLAAGKSAEYARFGLVPIIALSIWVVAAVARAAGGRLSAIPLAILLIATTGPAFLAPAGWAYLWSFVTDSSASDTRLRAAEELVEVRSGGAGSLLLRAEPAPYAIPPFDLWRTRAVLVPPGAPRQNHPYTTRFLTPADWPRSDLSTRVIQGQYVTPITWAQKGIVITTAGAAYRDQLPSDRPLNEFESDPTIPAGEG